MPASPGQAASAIALVAELALALALVRASAGRVHAIELELAPRAALARTTSGLIDGLPAFAVRARWRDGCNGGGGGREKAAVQSALLCASYVECGGRLGCLAAELLSCLAAWLTC